jgi:hypothetical protein
MRLLYEPTGFRRFADPTRPEHLMQFDREPTRNAFEQNAGSGVERVDVPPGTVRRCEVGPLALIRRRAARPLGTLVAVENDVMRIAVDPERLGLVSLITKADGREWVRDSAPFASGAPVSERLVHPAGFQVPVPGAVRDPSDAPWTRDHRFERALLGRVVTAEALEGSEGVGIALRVEKSPVRELLFRLDALRPDVLEVTARGRLDDDTSRHGIYLPFEFAAETGRDCGFRYDSGGLWLEVGRDQLPGSATSHYASWRGAAVEQGGRTIYLAARDTVLWQFGDFTFGHPQVELARRPFAAAWLYNNYWFCNVPPSSPGGFEAQFLIQTSRAVFDPCAADALYTVFAAGEMAHPVRGCQHA